MFSNSLKLNYLRSAVGQSIFLSRNYAFKTDLKVKWIRPEKIPSTKPEKSGDLSSFAAPDSKRLLPLFDRSEELKDADEIIVKMFTLEQNRKFNAVETARREAIDLVKRHQLDGGSIESKIARMTVSIRSMQEHMEAFPRDMKVKVELKLMIDQRKKFLGCLRTWDYRKFEWILEKLDLLYRPYPEKFHWITRKESLKKLCATHCEQVKQDKLEVYKMHLQSQQIGFLENKIKSLEHIREEQVACKVPITVTPEEIKAVKKQLAELMKKRQEEEDVAKKQSDKEDYELKL